MGYDYKDVSPKTGYEKDTGYNEVLDEDAIKESLRNLFMINQGEVPGKPWLGNPLNVFLFDNIGYFEVQGIKAAFMNIIEKFEPRVKIIDVKVTAEQAYNTINIEMTYIILIGDKNKLVNYRFSNSYNTYTNLSVRKELNG